jgi:hypothetical protein
MTKRQNLWILFRDGMASIGEGFASITLFPRMKTVDELEQELTEKYGHLGVDFTKKPHEKMRDDVKKVGNDMRRIVKGLKP